MQVNNNLLFLINSKFYILKNTFLETLFNFLYNEIVEACFCVFIFKGVWGIYDIFYNATYYALIVIEVFSALFFFIFTLNQKKIFKKYSSLFNSNKICLKFNKGTSLLNFVSLLAYISLIGMWDVIWKVFELMVLDAKNEFYILLAVHLIVAFFMLSMNSSTTLFGFGKISKENKSIEINPDELNEKIRIFQIKYLSVLLLRRF